MSRKDLIPQMLKMYREKTGMTKSEVARGMGANQPNSYSQYERGDVHPTVPQLEKILKSMGYELVLIVTPTTLTDTQQVMIGAVVNHPEYFEGKGIK